MSALLGFAPCVRAPLTRHLRARSQVDKRSALENLDLLFMTLDELVDGGCVARGANIVARSR